MSVYSTLRTIYKTVFPKNVRYFTYKYMPTPLKALKAYTIHQIEKLGQRNEIYNEDYYEPFFLPEMVKSFEEIANSIVKVFSPRTVIDVGCGPGVLLLALKKQGVICRGLDYSSAALKFCQQNGLNVTKFDIEYDVLPEDFKADVVVSTEVAEHLHESFADRFVNLLCTIADNVIITAAQPARNWKDISRAHGHVNEQPKEYWIAKFADNGFEYKHDVVGQLFSLWEGHQVVQFLVENLMVFRKQPCSPP